MKILIADDHDLFLKGLEFVLKSNFSNSQIVAAKNYTELFNVLQKESDFSLIVTDLAMPGAESISGIKKVHSLAPDIPIVILSAVFGQDIVRRTIDIGVSGYITKATSNDEILNAINMVLEGGVYIPAELFDAKDEIFKPLIEENFSSEEKQKVPNFSKRQLEVLERIAAGLSNKQIAFELSLSEGTVKFYVTAILKKLNVLNRTSAGLKAIKSRIISQKK